MASLESVFTTSRTPEIVRAAFSLGSLQLTRLDSRAEYEACVTVLPKERGAPYSDVMAAAPTTNEAKLTLTDSAKEERPELHLSGAVQIV